MPPSPEDINIGTWYFVHIDYNLKKSMSERERERKVCMIGIQEDAGNSELHFREIKRRGKGGGRKRKNIN